jgi:hypothetical protein
MNDELEIDDLRQVYLCAGALAKFMHEVVGPDPRQSPIVIQAQGPHAELYAAATRDRMQALWDALHRADERAAQRRAVAEGAVVVIEVPA